MKKILIVFAAAAGLFCAAPALAQDGTASLYYQHRYDSGYQDAIAHARYRDGYGYSYGYEYGYAYVPPVLGLIGGLIAGNSHKPANGELRTLPDGTTVSYDKQLNRWIPVNKPEQQPRAVYTDRDVYAAQ